MLDNLKRLDLTAEEIELIEAALHTQKKIVSMQSEAGGAGARQKLSRLKSLLQRISRSRQKETPQQPWFLTQLTRSLFCTEGSCSHSR